MSGKPGETRARVLGALSGGGRWLTDVAEELYMERKDVQCHVKRLVRDGLITRTVMPRPGYGKGGAAQSWLEVVLVVRPVEFPYGASFMEGGSAARQEARP